MAAALDGWEIGGNSQYPLRMGNTWRVRIKTDLSQLEYPFGLLGNASSGPRLDITVDLLERLRPGLCWLPECVDAIFLQHRRS